MSNKFQSAINNLGLSEIQALTDPAVCEIIHSFDKTPNKTSLANTILSIYGPVDLLSDRVKRNIIIKYLKEHDARALAKAVGINVTDEDPWDRLCKVKFGSKNQKVALYKFFEVSEHLESLEDHTKHEYLATQLISPEYPLFIHQENAASSIKEVLLESERVLLHMPTGAGKTRTSMNIVCDSLRGSLSQRSDKVVIWLADTEELCEQAADEFEKAWGFLGSGDACLQRLYGNYDLNLSEIKSGILVAGLAKLSRCFQVEQQERLSLARKCSLVIFDEAHKILAPTYQHIVELFQTAGPAKLLGLSATPGRATKDKEENRNLASFFRKQKVTLTVEGYDNPITYLQDEGYLAHIKYHDMPYSSSGIKLSQKEIQSITDRDDIPLRILDELGKDTKRNIQILNLVFEQINKHKKIILFACSVPHATALFALLRYKGIKVGLITSKTEKKRRRNIINAYKDGKLDILVNFGVLTAGFDAPITNVAIIARPTTSLTLYSQMVGRAARGVKAGGNENCDIYTVIDEEIPGFRDITEAFKHWDDVWE